jgi:integrase
VHRAAKYLLLQFTGLRYSEAAMLRAGCLQKAPSGEYVIRGTVIKGGTINELTNTDYWIAAPIVRDALLFL